MRYPILRLVAGCCLACLGAVGEARSAGVLILNSYSSLVPWTRDQVRGIASEIGARRPGLEIYTEYLDSNRLRGEGAEAAFLALMKQRYGSVPLLLVFTTDDDATRFAARYREELFPGAPVVFSGVADRALIDSLPRNAFTGVAEWFDMQKWVDQILALAPGRKTVFLVTDASTTGTANLVRVRQALARHAGLQVRELDGAELPFETILERLRAGPADSLVLASMFSRCQDGVSIPPHVASARIAAAARGPVASPNDAELGDGYLAGSANSGFNHGRLAGELGIRLLSGAPPETVPVVTQDVARLVVDDQVRRRWALEGALPVGAELIRQRPGLRQTFEQYRTEVLAGGAVVGLMAVLIVVLAHRARERRRVADELERGRAKLESAQSLAQLGVWEKDMTSGRLTWSREVFAIHGLPPEGLEPDSARVMEMVHAEDRERVRRLIEASEATRSSRSVEYRITRPDGSVRTLRSHGEWRVGPQGGLRVFGTVQDVTELREMEVAARQAHRLEAIGDLAGGIAHDFNNLLTVINGYSHLLLEKLPAGGGERGNAEAIHTAGQRAATLTRQLLAFSRRQILRAEAQTLDAILLDLEGQIRAQLKPAIELWLKPSGRLPEVRVDRGLLEQAVLHLVSNAVEAMPKGGRLTLATSLERVDGASGWAGAEVLPGEYACLSVADTGHGMDARTLERIFDPFFTTKPVGKGTGLGLASVYGTVKQMHGHIVAESRPGAGALFRVLFPVTGGVSGAGSGFDTPARPS